MSESEKLLEKIRALDGLKNALLSSIEVEEKGKRVQFVFITDRSYTKEEERQAEKIVGETVGTDFSSSVRIVKRNPDALILRGRIFEFMKRRFPAASSFLEEENIFVEKTESGGNFYFEIPSGRKAMFPADKILDEVSEHLSSLYCGAYFGNVKLVEKEEPLVLEKRITEEDEVVAVKKRYFPIVDFVPIDGAETKPVVAKYIADATEAEENLVLCGKIVYITKRESKSGKLYYALTISDGTGEMRASYFIKKATEEKIEKLKAGDWVVLLGANEIFNDNLSYKANKINFGRMPDGYQLEKRESKPVPKAYHTVFPEKYVDFSQTGLFDKAEPAFALKGKKFVVFDLETTGLINNPAMGKMDKIIELGAVKIEDGEITEKFSSFVACDMKLPQKIVELTGICDADLIGAPEVGKVLADFYKFADGCDFVGHNVQFDYRFVSYYGEENGFDFTRRTFDTLTIGQELLAGLVPNFKLNSLADYYGVVFNHHRAFDDALATAKVFIELVRKRGSLPL